MFRINTLARSASCAARRTLWARPAARVGANVPVCARAYSIPTEDLKATKSDHASGERAKWLGSVALLGALATGGIYYVRFVDNEDVALPLIPALDSKNFTNFKVAEIIDVSANTKIFRCEIPDSADVLGLPVASCVILRIQKGWKDAEKTKPNYVFRPYTPIESDDLVKEKKFDFLIKKYENGTATPLIFDLKAGDSIALRGPITKHLYKPNEFKNITLLAGGTGITPCLQIIRSVLQNTQEDKTQLHLVFGNINESDILLKAELDSYAAKYPEQFKVTYFVEKPGWYWKGQKGYITKDYLKSVLPAPAEENKIFVCGPNPMLAAIAGPKAKDFTQGPLAGSLKDLGFSEKDVFKF